MESRYQTSCYCRCGIAGSSRAPSTAHATSAKTRQQFIELGSLPAERIPPIPTSWEVVCGLAHTSLVGDAF